MYESRALIALVRGGGAAAILLGFNMGMQAAQAPQLGSKKPPEPKLRDGEAVPAGGMGIQRIPDAPQPAKVKLEIGEQLQGWGGGAVFVPPLLPAPEVVRLWDPAVTATVKVSARVLSAIADLDSRDFKTREAASLRLADGAVVAEEIFAVLVRGELTDEQRERLLTVAREKVLALPRGAIGIRMQPSGDSTRPGVEVQLLLPGLPAERVLKLFDRIERVDGKSIATSNDFVEIIQSKVPGEKVRLSVARPQRDERGKPRLVEGGGVVEDRFEVDVELTSAAELDKFEGQLGNATRSTVLERRLAALREAEVRFAPGTRKLVTKSIDRADESTQEAASPN